MGDSTSFIALTLQRAVYRFYHRLLRENDLRVYHAPLSGIHHASLMHIKISVL
jgi:hypothetical protein